MVRSAFLSVILTAILATPAHASDRIPTLEDAGYAYEASEQCETIEVRSDPSRQLKRSHRFRDGRRIFRNAIDQWGRDWACRIAGENHGNDIDLSDFFTGQRIVQPPADEIPPNPVLKQSYLERFLAIPSE
ncbi:MAG: hypothetical protein ACR2O4_07710 [Hyphomicrobiaceae bacterium]